jgi:hypothetical protein
MDLPSKRRLNERKFEKWDDLPGGGRKYSLAVKGTHGWSAQYVKEVDINEETVRFYQNIFNEKGILLEIHEKYPEDKGHRVVKEE